MTFRIPFEVRSYELDSLGHLNNAVYFSYLEESSFAFLAQHGLPFGAFPDLGYYPIVAHAEVDFLRELCVGDPIDVEGWAIEYGNTSMKIGYRFFRNEEPVAEALRVWVFVHDQRGKIPVPEEIRKAFGEAEGWRNLRSAERWNHI